jgi:hypothetical protein
MIINLNYLIRYAQYYLQAQPSGSFWELDDTFALAQRLSLTVFSYFSDFCSKAYGRDDSDWSSRKD